MRLTWHQVRDVNNEPCDPGVRGLHTGAHKSRLGHCVTRSHDVSRRSVKGLRDTQEARVSALPQDEALLADRRGMKREASLR